MTRTAEDQVLIDTLLQRAEQAEAQLAEKLREHAQASSRLRHDLRGILSPALLLADRLLMSQDPLSKRTAETMILTIERAEKALAKKP